MSEKNVSGALLRMTSTCTTVESAGLTTPRHWSMSVTLIEFWFLFPVATSGNVAVLSETSVSIAMVGGGLVWVAWVLKVNQAPAETTARQRQTRMATQRSLRGFTPGHSSI